MGEGRRVVEPEQKWRVVGKEKVEGGASAFVSRNAAEPASHSCDIQGGERMPSALPVIPNQFQVQNSDWETFYSLGGGPV